MVDWTEEKLLEVFGKAFQEVVVPILEDLTNRVSSLERRFDKVDQELVKINDKLDRHAKYYDDHEKRITRLELKGAVSPQ